VVDFSIVIPVYDEEANLPLLWEELRGVLDGLGLAFEVVFVDDGSRDRSAEIVRGFREADPRVRLVRLKANAGETAATDAGFKAVRGAWVVVMDADLQNDPSDIPRLLAHLDRRRRPDRRDAERDLRVGSRRSPRGARDAVRQAALPVACATG